MSRFVGIVAFCVSTLGLADVSSAQTTRPNVVLILADDLGFSDIASYGSEILACFPPGESVTTGGGTTIGRLPWTRDRDRPVGGGSTLRQ